MKGQILISILALGASSIALANGSMAAPAAGTAALATNDFDGLVLSIDAGVQHLAGNVQDNLGLLEVSGSTSTFTNIADLNTDVGDNSLAGGISVGYGKVFNSNYYFGGELYTRYAHNTSNTTTAFTAGTTNTTNENTPLASVDVSSDWSFGGALKLGYLLTPKTMIYLLAGAENSHLEANVSHPLDLNTLDSYSFSANKWAFVPGIGIETMFFNKLSLKAEYTYAAYGTFEGNHNKQLAYEGLHGFPTSEYLSSHDKINLNRGLFTLGLSYHFNSI